VKGVARIQNPTFAYDGVSIFNDSNSVSPIGLLINHKQLAYKATPDDKYVIVEYDVTNTNKTPLNNVYMGLFTDWDVDESSKNLLRYDEKNSLSYVYASTPLSPYAGIKLLSNGASPLFYPLSYQLGTDLLYDGNFTTAEKYQTLSSGIKATELGTGDGLDVMCVTGNGPYSIAPNKTVKVAFAVIVGDSLEDIKKSALAASVKYAEKPIEVDSVFTLSQNYPNPAKKITSVNISIPSDGFTSLEVFDYLGRKVQDVFAKNLKKGLYIESINLTGLKTGVYYYRCLFNGQQKANKMIVIE
jgi:hypothetical protein